jgi:ABC-2 type transport system permease protein
MNTVRAIGAEALKLTSTRLWWVLALVMFIYVGFTSGIIGLFFGGLGEALGETGQTPAIPDEMLPPIVYSIATSIGYVFPVILGALATTSEIRHQTLTPTFLATPKRGAVLAGKIVALGGFGALFGVIALIASIGLGAAMLAIGGFDLGLADSDNWALAGRAVIAMALWAIVGVGLGALIPSQVAAIVVVIAFTQFVEPILRTAAGVWEWAGEVGRFLPGAASDALVGASFYGAIGMGTAAPLEWWQGGLVLLGIALLTTVVGYFTTWRRDVT